MLLVYLFLSHTHTRTCRHVLDHEGKTKHPKVAEDAILGNSIWIENIKFENVKEFKYLRSIINSNNSITEEIIERMVTGERFYLIVYKLLGSNSIYRDSKLRIYKSVMRSPVISTYGLDSNKRGYEKAAYLWKVHAVQDESKCSAERFYEMIEFIKNFIKAVRIKSIGHIQRMANLRKN